MDRVAWSHIMETPLEDRDKAIDRFQNDEATRFFVGNAQTAEEFDTYCATNVIYYSNDFNLETEYNQRTDVWE